MSTIELTSETGLSEANTPSTHSISPIDDELQQIASRARLDREIALQVKDASFYVLSSYKNFSYKSSKNGANAKWPSGWSAASCTVRVVKSSSKKRWIDWRRRSGSMSGNRRRSMQCDIKKWLCCARKRDGFDTSATMKSASPYLTVYSNLPWTYSHCVLKRRIQYRRKPLLVCAKR